MRFHWAQAINHSFAKHLVAAAAAPNTAADCTGGLNRVFAHVMKVRLLFKRLKAWNRRVYYGGKCLLFIGIVAAIVWW